MINDREAGQEDNPPRPRPWHFYARGRYLGTVHDILTAEDIRKMYPYATIYAIGHTVDIWYPTIHVIHVDERPARAYDTLGPRDPRD